jgi:hypothetical protein
MWLFDPNSPCIAIFTRIPQNRTLCRIAGNLIPVTRNLPHDGPQLISRANRRRDRPSVPRRKTMLWTITIILFLLWLVGLISSYTFGGWIHILIVIAVIILIVNLLNGRRVL